jgi:hypothetical protein
MSEDKNGFSVNRSHLGYNDDDFFTTALEGLGLPEAQCCITKLIGDPNGIRTRVAGVKGQCPRPLDDGVAGRTQPLQARSQGHDLRGFRPKIKPFPPFLKDYFCKCQDWPKTARLKA